MRFLLFTLIFYILPSYLYNHEISQLKNKKIQMKKLILFLISVVFAGLTQAQTYDSVPPYLKTKEIPSFNILQTDSSWFRTKDLPAKQSTVIIYFNPECGHCQNTADELSKNIANFPNVTFLWVTYLSPMNEIETFKKNFNLDSNPNIHFGKDPQYFIPAFFRVEQTPFVALYNPKGKLEKAWPMYFSVAELQKALAK